MKSPSLRSVIAWSRQPRRQYWNQSSKPTSETVRTDSVRNGVPTRLVSNCAKP